MLIVHFFVRPRRFHQREMSGKHVRDFEQPDGRGRCRDGLVQGSLHHADLLKAGSANLDALLVGVSATHANVQAGQFRGFTLFLLKQRLSLFKSY
jgi:hypothetical protein